MWIFLSLIGALFQSITGALNKKNLQVSRDSIHLIAFINYAVAGIFLSLLVIYTSGHFIPTIHNYHTFIQGVLITIPFNTIAVVCGYRALRLAEYNYLAPWMTLSSLFILLPSFLLLGEVPTLPEALGIILIITGAILIDLKKKKPLLNESEQKEHQDNRTAKIYMIVVGLCFSITPVGMKMMIAESSPLFTAAIVHIILALTFLVWLFFFEKRSVFFPFKKMTRKNVSEFFFIAFITGIGYAIANGSINIALEMSQVSLVIAVKRIAPAFSFLIGYYLFHETKNAKRKVLATVIMVIGTILITLSK